MSAGSTPHPHPPPQAGEGKGGGAMLTLPQLRDLLDDPAAASRFSPFGAEPFLLFDTASEGFPSSDAVRIARWLLELPCPSIGIKSSGIDNATVKACDVLVEQAADAAGMIERIRRHPMAASVFVQVLRATEGMPVPQALVVESLAYATLQGGPEFRRWLAERPAEQPPPQDDGRAIVVDRKDDVLSIELNRPSNRNAISIEMRDALNEALQLALVDDSIKKIIVSGRGKCFSVGGDLAEFGTLPDPVSAHVIRRLTMPGRFVAACAERAEFRVHGACVGSGVELPAFAKRVIAAPDSYFHLPELEFGLLPGGGGCVSIPRRIGRQRSTWMVLSGKRIRAQTALDWGLIDEVA